MQRTTGRGKRPRIGPVTTGLYGLGTVSSGIELRALGSFLLIFYNQAVGMSPLSVSLAITLVIVVDAVMDPLVGARKIASIRNSEAPTLTIPAGASGKITLEIEMVCDYIPCKHFVRS